MCISVGRMRLFFFYSYLANQPLSDQHHNSYFFSAFVSMSFYTKIFQVADGKKMQLSQNLIFRNFLWVLMNQK